MRALGACLIAAVALMAAGCGAREEGAARGAEIVPAGAPVFISIDSDLGSDQWQKVDDLLHSFPGRTQLLGVARAWLRGNSGLDYEQDVKPALGDELDLVRLDFEAGGGYVVAIAKPKDEVAFRRMVEKANRAGASSDSLLIGEVGGWLVLSDEQAKIDRFREASSGDKLADDGTFEDAMGELPDAALVKVYAKDRSLLGLFEEALMGAVAPAEAEPEQPELVAAALAAEDDGLRLSGLSRSADELTKAAPYQSKLLDDVPADAVAFFTVRGDSSFLEQARSSPIFRRMDEQFQQMFQVPLDKVIGIFDNEVALYVRPGSPIPEVTMLLEAPGDEPAEEPVFRRVDALMETLTRLTPAQPCHAPTVEDGVTVTCIDFGEVAIRYAGFDEKVVVTTGRSPVAELRSEGPKLPDAVDYRQARKAAGLPSENAGFLWIDAAKAIPMILGFAEAADEPVPAELRANLEPLESLLLWGEVAGRTSSFSAFLEID
jgi:uncharacterized protein DUF3352